LGDLDGFTFLVEKGAQPECPEFFIDIQDANGDTPLHHALAHNHEELVSFILSKGAHLNIANLKGEYPLHLAALSSPALLKILVSKESVDLEVRNKCGATPLNAACLNGNVEAVKILLELVVILHPT